MTVSSETYRVQYAGNAVTTAFTVPFRFLANSQVLAIHTDASDADTIWVENTHYTLTGVGAETGTLTVKTVPTDYTPATGTRLTITRDLSLTQTTDYVSNDDFPAQTHEDDHDKFVMLLQQVQEQLDRTIKLKASTTDYPLLADDISTAAAALSALAVASSLTATSTSSNSIGTGAKTFTIQADKYFSSGDFIFVKDSAAPATSYLFGQVTSYSGTTLIIDSQLAVGSGTKTAWAINLAGPRGQTGASPGPDPPYLASDVNYTPAGTGADARTVQSRLRDRATVFDFIPTTEHAAIQARTSTYDTSTDLQAAITAVGGKAPLYVPNGQYIVTVGQKFITTSTDIMTPGLELIGDGGESTIFDNRVGLTNHSNNIATTNASVQVVVTRTAHGKLVHEQFEIFGASATVGGLSLNGIWYISAVTANTFTFNHSSTATSTANASIDYGEINPLFDIDTNTELKFQHFVKLANFKIRNTTSPTGSTGIRIRRAWHVDIERIRIHGMRWDGLQITVPNPTAGDYDGGNQITVRHCRIDDCLNWGIRCELRPGNNELSFLGIHDTFIQGCGTASGASPPPSGGMKWKGQAFRCSNLAFTINQNVGLYIPGGAGLSNTVSADTLILENNVKRGAFITGLRQGEFSNIHIYNNDSFVATVGIEIDGASSVVDNIRVNGAVIRATSGNNPFTAFKLTGANADADTCRIDHRDIAWDNFDYAGQIRWGGWSIDHTNFSAHKNAVDQTGIVSATWTKITFGSEFSDDGGFYDTTNSRWTPSPGKGRLAAAVMVTAGMVDLAQSILAIYKNGALLRYISVVNSSGTTSFGMIGECQEIFTGTDYYEVWFNGGGAGNKTVSGATAQSYFQGAML